MSNNRKYFILTVIYSFVLSLVFFWGFGYLMLFLYEIVIGIPKELDLIMYGFLGLYGAFFGLLLSYIIFFLTISKIYKKLGASFNFKHPILYTSIIIFILGNILFYLAMLVWTFVK